MNDDIGRLNETTYKIIGRPLDRVDGRLKVTGAARYAAEFALPHLCHAVMVQSTIASGRIIAIDAREVERLKGDPGVETVAKLRAKGALNRAAPTAFPCLVRLKADTARAQL